MYMRLAFAVAAHLETENLIVDEVLAVGDADFQKKCLGKMKEVGSAGRTVLFVRHQMNSIERLCGRVVVLDRGRVAGIFNDARQGVLSYLRSSQTAPQASVWRNDQPEGDEFFRPLRFELASESNAAASGGSFSNEHPLVLSVEGELRTADRLFNIGVALYGEDGSLLFWSFMRDGEAASWPALRPGRVRLGTRIPARWLNEGSYRLELLAGFYYGQWLLPPQGNGPSIQFSIRGGLSDSPLWDHRRPGLLAPVLRWQLSDARVTNRAGETTTSVA